MKYLKWLILGSMVIVPLLYWYKIMRSTNVSIDGSPSSFEINNTVPEQQDVVTDETKNIAVPDKFTYQALINCKTDSQLMDMYGENSLVDNGLVEPEGQPIEGSRWIILLKGTRNECHIKRLVDKTVFEFHYANSDWSLPLGLCVDMDLSELEEINGSAVSFYGFEWDYPGSIYSWNSGQLSRLKGLKLGGALGSDDEYIDEVLGDIELNSEMEIFNVKYPNLKLVSIYLSMDTDQ